MVNITAAVVNNSPNGIRLPASSRNAGSVWRGLALANHHSMASGLDLREGFPDRGHLVVVAGAGRLVEGAVDALEVAIELRLDEVPPEAGRAADQVLLGLEG